MEVVKVGASSMVTMVDYIISKAGRATGHLAHPLFPGRLSPVIALLSWYM